jgi:hypothetical protein
MRSGFELKYEQRFNISVDTDALRRSPSAAGSFAMRRSPLR